jgi:hypothetical protein
MVEVKFRVSEEEYEVLVEQKENLGLTWEQAMVRGLAVGPTPIEKAGLPDPVKQATAAAIREDEFLKKLQETTEE